ncbi:MAG: hypothetical protein EA425_12000 [Puniceicoccaceae bacterium]|nr:MAG: hypothetical protein EA425_12000 [Puniceicoccaceae bacterium]
MTRSHAGRFWNVVAAARALASGAAAARLGWRHGGVEAGRAREHPIGEVGFFTAMALLPAAGIPTTPFFVLAGAVFGLTTGLIGTAVAVAINLIFCYWLARTLLRRPLRHLLEHFDYRIPPYERRRSVSFILLVKMAPGVPAFVKNYAAALAGAPLGIYLALCWTITMGYAAGFILLGESILERNPLGVAAAVVILLLCIGFFAYLRRRGKGSSDSTADRDDEPEAEQPAPR